MRELVVADRRYSSWSLRAWLVLEAAGVPFETRVIRLFRPDTAALLREVSPSGKVPCLLEREGDAVRPLVWDSLAIAETLAEERTDLWPGRREDRALARAITAEMHSGFLALRESCPFDLQRPVEAIDLDDPTREDVERLVARILDAKRRHPGGEYLFGPFGIVDAYLTPIAVRFRSYAIEIPSAVRHYTEALLARPAFRAWEAEALIER